LIFKIKLDKNPGTISKILEAHKICKQLLRNLPQQ